MEVNIYMVNLGLYNEGKLVGEWIELPTDEDKINDVIKKVLTQDGKYPEGLFEEIAIHDFEGDFEVSEYDCIHELNDFLESVKNYDEEVVVALMELGEKHEIQEILDNGDFSYVKNVATPFDLAMNADEEQLPFDSVAVNKAGALSYIDWEYVGMEMENSGWYITNNKVAILIY